MNNIILTDSLSPYHNLALEEYLFDTYDGNGITMYLWQNKNTIVIGRTQNAFRECKVTEFERDGGSIARRPTGGGTVFHDTGNLNFTFICNKQLYDEKRQLGVILSAVKSFGIDAEFSGRNDLLSDGRKFSGNAFRHTKDRSMHHGTILFNADMSRLAAYLQVSKAKMESKGIKSVQSRVINLCELNPSITVEGLKTALITAFTNEYGTAKSSVINNPESNPLLEKYISKYCSWEWRFGENPQFNTEISRRFSFGEITLMLEVDSSKIIKAKVYSDMLNTDFPPALERALTGTLYSANSVKEKVSAELSTFMETAEFCAAADEMF